jgi:hypothetical protein
MNRKKNRYSGEPMGSLRRTDDFLPSGADLVLKDEFVEVKISVTLRTIEFLKREAETLGTDYQTMIRNLLEEYAKRNDDNGSAAVIGEGNTVVLKGMAPAPVIEFKEMIRKAREAALEGGLSLEDINKAIREVRSEECLSEKDVTEK